MAMVFQRETMMGPAAHALVIGVGGYRHLVGGVDPRNQTLEHVGLMKQLSSPPRSAAAFAQHLIRAQDSLKAPLASVELLTSLAPDDEFSFPEGLKPSPATIAEIERAYDAWTTRCDTHANNLALFYFCGHGLEKLEQYLLAEDFGAAPNNPWRGAFAFDSTRRSFHSCHAESQCFFIDACRNITSGMLTHNPIVAPLGIENFQAADCAFDLTMKATAGNEKALGPENGVSYFTQALIRALSGAAATTSADGSWEVTSGRIAAEITRILRLVKEEEGFKQRCSSQVTDSTVLVRNVQPKVAVVLSCSPDEANQAADLKWTQLAVAGQPKTLQHVGGPWRIELDAGFWEAQANFAAGGFTNATRQIFAEPPVQSPVLRCAP